MKCSKRRIFAGVAVLSTLVLASLTSGRADERPRYSILQKDRPREGGGVFSQENSHLAQAVVNAGSWAPLAYDWPQETCPYESRYVEENQSRTGDSEVKKDASTTDGSGTLKTRPTRPASFSPRRLVPYLPELKSTPPVWFWDGPLAAGSDGPFRVDLKAPVWKFPVRIGWLPANVNANRSFLARPATEDAPAMASSFKASDFQAYVDPFDQVGAPWDSLGEQYLAQNQTAEAKSNIVVRERNMVRELYQIAKSHFDVFRRDQFADLRTWVPVKRVFAGFAEQTGQPPEKQASKPTTLKAVNAAFQPIRNWADYHTGHFSDLWTASSWGHRLAYVDREVEMRLCGTRFLNDWGQLKMAWREIQIDSQVVSHESFTVSKWALDQTADWLDRAGRQLQSASQSLRRTVEQRNHHQAWRPSLSTPR